MTDEMIRLARELADLQKQYDALGEQIEAKSTVLKQLADAEYGKTGNKKPIFGVWIEEQRKIIVNRVKGNDFYMREYKGLYRIDESKVKKMVQNDTIHPDEYEEAGITVEIVPVTKVSSKLYKEPLDFLTGKNDEL